MEQPQKKVKVDDITTSNNPDFNIIYQDIKKSSLSLQDHPYATLMKALRLNKHPILPVVTSQAEVYKTNPQRKKKPIQLYLDTITHLYKKHDLEILINPATPYSVFQRWAPREVAIFEESILKFGKQFQFIAQMIETKNAKEVYEFYLQWKSTSHYKSFRNFVTSNRSSVQDYI